LAHVYCGQMAGWMKTPLGTEVDLGPGHIVLDGVPAPAKGVQRSPLFSAHVHCGHGRPSQLLLSYCLFVSVWQNWLLVSFWAHVNIVHRIVSYRTSTTNTLHMSLQHID